MTCRRCGKAVPDGAKFCAWCGAPTPEHLRARWSQLRAGSATWEPCRRCGSKRVKAQTGAQVSAVIALIVFAILAPVAFAFINGLGFHVGGERWVIIGSLVLAGLGVITLVLQGASGSRPFECSDCGYRWSLAKR